MRQLLDIVLGDAAAERVRLSVFAAVRELQAAVFARARAVPAELADGVATTVSHGLGREPVFVGISVVRGATSTGRIVESRSGVDRTKGVLLTASGWGATITVDLLVM